MIVIMHICSDGKAAGGATSTLLRLLKNSDKSKFRHIVVIPLENPKFDEFSSLDIELIALKHSSDKSISVRALREVIVYIKKHRPDIIHTHGALYGRIAGRLCGVRSLLYTRHTYSDKTHSFFSKAVNRSVTDRVVSVSRALTKQIINSGIRESKITYIENGCEELSDIRFKTRDKYRLLYLGRLSEGKGIHTALEAVRILHDECDRFSLYIAGDGDMKCSIEEFIETNHMNEYVTLLPYQDDIVPLLSECGIMLNCSNKNEATSNSIIEGFCASMPVCASSVAGNMLVVTNGKDGITYDAGEPLSLSDAVKTVLSDYDTYSACARKTYLDRFTACTMAKKYEELWMDEYERTCNEKR